MAIKVKYLTEDEIERDAKLLLAEYEDTIGEPIKLPVPVDDIATSHLALRLDFDDLHKTLNRPMLRSQPYILGAILIEEELVLIDQHLNPKNNPSMLGRYRFTLAHEIGHFRLHRSYFADHNRIFLCDAPSEPTVICRASEEYKRIEWQANFFASCLLMPRRPVYGKWKECLGRTRPLLLSDLRPNGRGMMRDAQSMVYEQADDDALFEEVAKPIAGCFGVSAQAMRVRLEYLGLLLRQVPQQALLTVDP